MRSIGTVALAAIAAAGLATTADARRVAVDEGVDSVLGGCSLAFDTKVPALCNPVNLGFTVGITVVRDEEFGDLIDYYDKVVLYDDGFISFGGEVDFFRPDEPGIADRPVILARFELQDFQPLGQFVSDASEVVRGPGTFRAFWYRANVFWTCTRFDEEDEFFCIDGFTTTIRQPPHASLLIKSLPGGGARMTLRWKEGATDFGYALGVEERALGGNGERIFRTKFGPFEPIPEPATWAMMIAGFGLVGAAARQKRRLSAG